MADCHRGRAYIFAHQGSGAAVGVAHVRAWLECRRMVSTQGPVELCRWGSVCVAAALKRPKVLPTPSLKGRQYLDHLFSFPGLLGTRDLVQGHPALSLGLHGRPSLH